MTADEIRKESGNNCEKLYTWSETTGRILELLQYASQMETAAQLAELNATLKAWTDRGQFLATKQFSAAASER